MAVECCDVGLSVTKTIEKSQEKVGETLPKGWKQCKLGSVCDIVARQVDPKLPQYGALPHVNGENIEGGTCRLLYLRTAAEEGMTSGKYLFEPGNVLYSKLRPYLRKAVYVDFRGVCSADMYPLTVDSDVLDPHFLTWLLISDEFTSYADAQSRRARMPKLNREQLFDWDVLLPPLAEQKRIVAILSEQMAAVEKARAATLAQIEAAKALPAAYLRQVFDSPEAQKWERKKLGEVALSVQNGIYKSSENYGHGHSFLRMYNIRNTSWNLNLDTLAQVSLNDDELEKFQLEVGDLLISRVNSFELVGKCGWVGSEAQGHVFENMLIRVRLMDSVDSLFVAQQMGHRTIRQQIQGVAKQAIGQASINSTDIRNVKIMLPPFTEQKNISAKLTEKLEQAECLQRSLQEQLDAINKLPAAILRQAFNGEL